MARKSFLGSIIYRASCASSVGDIRLDCSKYNDEERTWPGSHSWVA